MATLEYGTGARAEQYPTHEERIGVCCWSSGDSVATVAESTVATEPNTHTITARPLGALCTRRRRCGMSGEYHHSRPPRFRASNNLD